MNKYKTSTFLTGLFCKFHLQDKDIRKNISEIYSTLIDIILKDVSEEKRIIVFKILIPSIKETIDYFIYIKQNELQPDKKLLRVIKQLMIYNVQIIKKIGIKDNKNIQIFDNILKQAFIDEIACDIGECIREYKIAYKKSVKAEIVDRLTVLLTDYNIIMHTVLTVENVLKENK